jgi:hypothetical protein
MSKPLGTRGLWPAIVLCDASRLDLREFSISRIAGNVQREDSIDPISMGVEASLHIIE